MCLVFKRIFLFLALFVLCFNTNAQLSRPGNSIANAITNITSPVFSITLGGNASTIGATTDTPQFARLGLGTAADANNTLTISNSAVSSVPLTVNAFTGETNNVALLNVGGAEVFRIANNGSFRLSVGQKWTSHNGATDYPNTSVSVAGHLDQVSIQAGSLQFFGPGAAVLLVAESGAILQLGVDAASVVTPQTIKAADGSGTDKDSAGLDLKGGTPTGVGLPRRVRIGVSTNSTSTGSAALSYGTAVSAGGTLNVNTTTTGNVGGGEDNLISYTIPGAELGVNGDYIEFDVWGSFAANANTKDVKVYFGSTVLIDTTALVLNGIDWRAHGKVVRTGATTQIAIAELTVGGTLLSALNGTIVSSSSPGETLSGNVVFKCTSTDSGGVPVDNSIVQKGLVIKWYPGQ